MDGDPQKRWLNFWMRFTPSREAAASDGYVSSIIKMITLIVRSTVSGHSRSRVCTFIRPRWDRELERRVRGLGTLRASLSGTFLQTLPELVTPLKGYSSSRRSCLPTRSAPSERVRYEYDCRSSLASKHPRKHKTHPPRVKKNKKKTEFRLDSNDYGFICAGVNFVGGYKWHALVYFSCL